MIARLHTKKHSSKLLKIDTLLGLERVLDEERDDVLEQVLPRAHSVGHSIAVVDSNNPTAEERLQRVKQLNIALVLHDGEFRKNLSACSHLRMLTDSDVKTAFTIHKAYDPLSVKIHWQIPNVKSLRVPCAARAFPADCPRVRLIFTARVERTSTERLLRRFPHMVRFY
jgi:hypothetical protein